MLEPQIHITQESGFAPNKGQWICYKRNYFSLSCAFTTKPHPGPGPLHLRRSHDSAPIQIVAFAVKISATVDKPYGDPAELIVNTPKRDHSPKEAPGLKILQIGAEVAFERIQFKHASADHGGRRRKLKEFVVNVELYADMGADYHEDRYITIANKASCPVVVRGRSPQHYMGVKALGKTQSAIFSVDVSSTGTCASAIGDNGGQTCSHRSNLSNLRLPTKIRVPPEDQATLSEMPSYSSQYEDFLDNYINQYQRARYQDSGRSPTVKSFSSVLLPTRQHNFTSSSQRSAKHIEGEAANHQDKEVFVDLIDGEDATWDSSWEPLHHLPPISHHHMMGNVYDPKIHSFARPSISSNIFSSGNIWESSSKRLPHFPQNSAHGTNM